MLENAIRFIRCICPRCVSLSYPLRLNDKSDITRSAAASEMADPLHGKRSLNICEEWGWTNEVSSVHNLGHHPVGVRPRFHKPPLMSTQREPSPFSQYLHFLGWLWYVRDPRRVAEDQVNPVYHWSEWSGFDSDCRFHQSPRRPPADAWAFHERRLGRGCSHVLDVKLPGRHHCDFLARCWRRRYWWGYGRWMMIHGWTMWTSHNSPVRYACHVQKMISLDEY